MDYSMRGNWAVMQIMGDVLPFFNARLQGLYKLGRSGAVPGTGMRAEVVGRGSMIALASIALYMLNKDREEYEELEEWDKDTYWHFWLGISTSRCPSRSRLDYCTAPCRSARRAS